MRIALNAQLLSFADSYRSGGISRVIYHTLAELGRDPRGHAYDVFVPNAPETTAGARSQFHASGAQTVSPSRRIIWEQTSFARQLRQLKPDLLHGMAYAVPVGWSGPSVVTVYDLSFLLFPKAFKAANRIYLAATTRAAARRARRVLTISEHARRDIVRLLNVPEACVDVTYPAVEDRYRRLPEDEVAAFRRSPRTARSVRLHSGHAGATQKPGGPAARVCPARQAPTPAVCRGRQRLARESHL